MVEVMNMIFLKFSKITLGKTGARSNTFFLFAISLMINFVSKFLFNMKNLDLCLTNIKKINK